LIHFKTLFTRNIGITIFIRTYSVTKLKASGLEPQNYPKLFQESDSSAIRAQRKYFWLVRLKIVLLLITAVVASVAWNQIPEFRTPATVVLAIILVSAMVISAIMDTKKFDHLWFRSRAIAESVKTESWSFMMKVGPYDSSITDSEAEIRFLGRLKEILQRQPLICGELALYSEGGVPITPQMRLIRNENLKSRRTFYIQNRISDQRLWYGKKAKLNKSQEFKWFIIAWILQLGAVAFAILVIVLEEIFINPVGIITTAGASVLSWMHARNYQELAQSYGLIVQELSLLEEKAKTASSEEELSEIVEDTEKTISREHTIWLARRL